MDSTPTPAPTPTPTQQPNDPHTLSTKSKLPIKRKTPETTSATVYGGGGSRGGGGGGGDDSPRPPPFKFHRIWTEPDEIRFLQGLLDSAADHLSFPRDLNMFYTRFSNAMSQPYTKSQLSEKLRRLRKKFRVISTRLSKGLDPSLLSPHDRALYHLSKQLWHPDFAMSSPFSTPNCVDYNNNNNNNNNNNGRFDNQRNGYSDNSSNKSGLVGVKVSFSPNLPGLDQESLMISRGDNDNDNEEEDGVDVKLSEVNVEFEEDGVGVGIGVEEEEEEEMVGQNGHGVRVKEEEMVETGLGVGGGGVVGQGVNGVGEVAAKAVINVFNEALEEVRMGIIVGGGSKVNGRLELGNEDESVKKRWQEQRVAELDVFARRLRLVFNNSLPKQ